MNTLERTSLVAVPVLGFLASAFAMVAQTQRLGADTVARRHFRVIVVMAHIAEAFDVWPSTGWGKPHTVGHYTDLISAVSSVVFVSVAAILALCSRASSS